MIYAIIGIPLTLSVLADIGQILATIINKMMEQYKQVLLPLLHKHKVFAQKSRSVYSNFQDLRMMVFVKGMRTRTRKNWRKGMKTKRTRMTMTRAGCSVTSRLP